NIVAEQRPVFHAEAQVDADEPVNILLKNKLPQHGHIVKPQDVGVADQAQLGRHIRIDAEVEQEKTRVDEIALPLELAGPQVGNQAFPVDQVYAEQPDCLPLPITKFATGEIRVIQNGIEATGVAIARIFVTRGPEHGCSETEPVAVVRQFQ